MANPNQVVVHFYRAIVMHADVWRRRLDATTNWAVVTNVGVISFSFTRPQSPHFLLLLLVIASCLFLLMESRRYQIYDLWRRRIRTLNRFIIAPQLSSQNTPSEEIITHELDELADDLGRAVPHLHFIDALGYRIRRNYGFLFLFSVGSWFLKLALHPVESTSWGETISRASIGGISGSITLVIVALGSLIVFFLALRAPSEQMVQWREIPPPLKRIKRGWLFRRPMTEEEEEQKPVLPDDE